MEDRLFSGTSGKERKKRYKKTENRIDKLWCIDYSVSQIQDMHHSSRGKRYMEIIKNKEVSAQYYKDNHKNKAFEIAIYKAG